MTKTLSTFHIDTLEPRQHFAAVAPTDWEQYMLELVNRARANPAAEAARYGIALNEGLPAGTLSADAKQPLAFNAYAIDAARKHSAWLIANDAFSHTGAGGTNPGARMVSAGYGAANTFGWGENLAYYGSFPNTPALTATTAIEHEGLFVDKDVAGRGHRINILKAEFKEVGIGIATGEYQTYNGLISTQDFGYKTGNSFLTGVAFADTTTADNFYTPGEGLGGVTIQAVRSSDNAVYTTTTWETGGYSLALPAGTYNVTASGGELSEAVQFSGVVIGSSNVKQDFRPGQGTSPVSPPAVPPTSPPVSPPVSPPAGPPPPAGIARGAVWNDTNGDGKRQRAEAGLTGQTVWLDTDGDGVLDEDEPTTETDAAGGYAFTELDVGSYQVKLATPAGWKMTSAGNDSRTIGIAGKKPPKVLPFGLTQSVTISGSVFADDNASGTREAEELVFRKAKVYLDLNGDGVRQKDERMVKVNAAGEFRFAGLAAGDYSVRLLMKPMFSATVPAGGIAVETSEWTPNAMDIANHVVTTTDTEVSR